MPELGKATYFLVLNSREFDAGITRAEQRAMRATDRIATGFAKADTAINTIGPTTQKAATQVVASTGSMTTAFAETGVAATKAAGTSEVAATRQASWRRAAVAIKASTASIVHSVLAADRAMIASGKKMRGIGRNMTRNFTLPAAIVTGVGVKMALDYQEQISLLGAQAGASADEMAMMTEEIKKMAASGKVVHTANQPAEAMFNIESSGFRGAKALEVLNYASQLAMVGNSELGDSTRALAGAMKTQIKGTETAAKTVGLLNSIVGAGMMRMPELVEALGTGILDPAASMGLGLQDVGAALAVFTSRGLPATQTATRLRMALNMMAAPTAKAKDALNEIGIGSQDMANIMRGPGGLPAALDFLVMKLEKIKDPVRRYQLVSEAFGGAKSGATMISLIRSLDDLHAKYEQVGGDADKIKKTILEEQQEPINKLRIAWAQLSTALINLGNTAIPVLVTLAGVVVRVIQAFQKLPGPIKAVVIGLGLLLAVAGPILSMIGLMMIGLGGLGMAVRTLSISLGGLRLAMIAVATNPLTAVFAAAALAAWGLYQAINAVNSALDAQQRAQDRTMTQQSQITDVFTLRYKQLLDRGLKPAAARKQAQKDAAAFAKRAGFDVSGGLFRAPGSKEKKPPKMEIPTFKVPGVGVDKKPEEAKVKEEPPLLPVSLRLKLTRAERTKTLRDDMAVAREEEALYRKLLQNAKLRGEKRLEVEQALTAVMQRIDSLVEQSAEKGGIRYRMPGFRKRLQRVKATETLRDNLRFWKDERSYLQGLLKNKNLEYAARRQIQKDLEAANKKIEAIKKKEAAEQERHFKRLRELQAVMDLRGSFFSEFASNVFGQSAAGLTLNVSGQRAGDKNLTVNQANTYNEIPRNRHGQARHMQKAAASAMEGM